MIKIVIDNLYEKNLINSQEYIKIEESTNHDVYAIGDIILKIDKDKDRLYKEYIILLRINTTVNCPKPLFFEQVALENSSYFVLGIEKIDGKPLSYFWGNDSIDQQKNLIKSIVSEVRNIHAYNADQIYTKELSEKIFYKNFITHKFAYIEKAKVNPNIDSLEVILLSNTFLKHYKDYMDNEPNNILVHNDIRYKNLLVNEQGELTGVIDFEEGLLGPKYIEYFRICDHLFFAQNYIEDGGENYTEIEFLKMLIGGFEEFYPECIFSKDSPERILYSLATYVRLLANFEETWYNHGECVRFREEYLNILDK